MNAPQASRRPSIHLLTSVSALCLMMGQAAPALAEGALPSGGRVAAGEAQIGNAASGKLEINQSSDNAIINWNDFSIGQGNAVQINNGAGATLNRVTGADQSVINGVLSSTGSVYVINPNGLIVGKTGVVKTGGSFVASTHNINNDDFMNGGDATFASDSQAGVDNLGTITSLAGDVTLIARKVRNEGQINAAKGTVGLAAGQKVLLRDGSFADGQLLVRVGGADDEITDSVTIRAAGAELRAAGGNIFALAGNAGGVITATGVAEQDGRIFLTAGDTGQIGVDKQITASRGSDGGDITIQAGFVSLGGDIRADGHNGGSVAISGSRVSLADTVSAAGIAGDGGTIEVAALGDSLVFETANLDASGS